MNNIFLVSRVYRKTPQHICVDACTINQVRKSQKVDSVYVNIAFSVTALKKTLGWVTNKIHCLGPSTHCTLIVVIQEMCDTQSMQHKINQKVLEMGTFIFLSKHKITFSCVLAVLSSILSTAGKMQQK